MPSRHPSTFPEHSRTFLPSLPSTVTCLLLAAACLLLATGCGHRETAVEAGLRTQTLLVGNGVEPPDLDPHTNNSLAVGFIGNALFEGLVRFAGDGQAILPGVAERWEISADGLAYTFHLRSDARWSNGDAITAGDFVAAFRRFLDPQLACEAVNIAFPIVGARAFVEGRSRDFSTVGIAAPDPRTVELHLRFRAVYFLSVLADSHLVPVHQPSLDRFGGRTKRGAQWTRPGNLVTNGPFLLKDWQPNVVLVVARNSRYWDAARVHLNEIRFFPIEDTAVEERAYRAGQLHITFTLSSGKVAAYLDRHAPELKLTPILNTNYVTFGTGRAPFNDPRVRRAFSLAIDRDLLAATVFKGRGDAAHSFIRPGAGGYDLGVFTRHDPAEAKALLRAAGFPDGAGFPAVDLTLGNRSEESLLYGQAIQQMWLQTLGVRVQLAPVEFKVWLDLLRTKSFAVTLDDWNMGVNDPSDMLALGVTGDPNNDAGWSNARYDAAYAAMENAPDDTARRAAMIACEKIIAEEVPYAPIYHAINPRLVHPSVHGWRNNAVQTIDWAAAYLEAPK